MGEEHILGIGIITTMPEMGLTGKPTEIIETITGIPRVEGVAPVGETDRHVAEGGELGHTACVELIVDTHTQMPSETRSLNTDTTDTRKVEENSENTTNMATKVRSRVVIPPNPHSVARVCRYIYITSTNYVFRENIDCVL